jgi:AraC family transcriptional regulator
MQPIAHSGTGGAIPRRIAVGSWHAELFPRHGYCVALTLDLPSIGFAFDGQIGVHAFAGDRRVDFRARPNGLAYVPPGCDVYSQSDVGGEYLKITFASDADDAWADTRRFNDVIDAVAINAAERLRRQLLAPDGVDELACERHIWRLKERAACVLNGPPAPAARSWMTPRRLKLIDDLIEAKLDGKLTVQELAQALRLSTGFFCRAFRAAVGKPPHDYIIDRRVARVRALLADASVDLTAIAQASGFASHAHMTATFRHRLGVTPSALRSDRG